MNALIRHGANTTGVRPFLTVRDVATHLSVSVPTVYRWIERRSIRYHKFGGVLRFHAHDIETFVTGGRFDAINPDPSHSYVRPPT